MENNRARKGEEKDRPSYSRGRGGRRGNRDRDSYSGRGRPPREGDASSGKPNPKTDDEDVRTTNVFSTLQSQPITNPNDIPRPEPGIGTEHESRSIRSPPLIDISRLGWATLHSKWCEYGCSNENIHYSRWRDAYDSHLLDLHAVFSDRVNSSKVSFNLFAEFVYLNSSGYISEFD